MTRNEPTGTPSSNEAACPIETEVLFALVYEELRKLAERQLATEPSQITLQATALVHEAYLKLSGGDRTWSGRRQFFTSAAEAMRRILVDHARRRKRQRHGGEHKRVAADLGLLPQVRPDDEVLAIADVLSQFEAIDPRAAQLVKLRYFIGCSLNDASDIMGISRSTATRDWAYAKAWLLARLSEVPPQPGAADLPRTDSQ